MNMIKIAALVQCRSHWQWIYDNTERLMLKNPLITPEDIKFAYFEKYIYSIPSAGCFCCEYDEKFFDSCSHCPLTGFAWKEHCMRNTENFPSLFANWCSFVSARNIVAACRNAKEMVDACTLALEKE